MVSYIENKNCETEVYNGVNYIERRSNKSLTVQKPKKKIIYIFAYLLTFKIIYKNTIYYYNYLYY